MNTTKDNGTRMHFKSGMQREVKADKPTYALTIPIGAQYPMLTRWAALLARGAVKYAARDWEKANSVDEMEHFKEAAFRHFIQWIRGENDEDHAAAVYFNIQAAEFVKEKLTKKK